ncbi:MAG: aminoacyl-tRNA hydrolase [Flavobacteriales bacterium]
MKKFLIAGLGNIGSEYENTRHNIGFNIVDALAESKKGIWETDRLAQRCVIKIRGRQVILIKPSTYMNLSGKAIQYHLKQHQIPLENLMIATDDLSLDFGAIRIRKKGSAGGHNGHKSIIESLQSDQYARLRFGISSNYSKGKQVDYVLGKWSSEEQKTLPELVEHCSKAIECYVFRGISDCMSTFNKKT